MTTGQIDSLTPREKDCLRLILKTDAHKQIAFLLGISTNTVEGHLKSANRKLAVNSSFRAAQMLAAHEAGAPPPQSWGDHPTPLSSSEVKALPNGSAAAARAQSGFLQKWFRLPVQRVREGGNDLAAAQRLRETVQAAFVAIAMIGVIVAALTGLGILAHTWFDQP